MSICIEMYLISLQIANTYFKNYNTKVENEGIIQLLLMTISSLWRTVLSVSCQITEMSIQNNLCCYNTEF